MYTNTIIINKSLHSPFVRKPFCILFFCFWRSPRHLQIKRRRGKYATKPATGIGTLENIINIILCRGTTGSRDMGRDGDGDEWRRRVVVAVYNRYHTATAESEYTIFI